jgi:hypothetical protein
LSTVWRKRRKLTDLAVQHAREGTVYRPTSVQIILSHKLGKRNIWVKEEVVSLPVELMVFKAILQKLNVIFVCAAGYSCIPLCYQEYLFTACAHRSMCLSFTFPSLRPSVSQFRLSLLLIS